MKLQAKYPTNCSGKHFCQSVGIKRILSSQRFVPMLCNLSILHIVHFAYHQVCCVLRGLWSNRLKYYSSSVSPVYPWHCTSTRVNVDGQAGGPTQTPADTDTVVVVLVAH